MVKNRSLAYLLVRKDGILVDAGGALSAYGLETVRAGTRPRKELFFLEGFLPLEGEPVCLPRVKVGTELSTDVHIFSGDAGDWILLLDATLEETRERLLQQCSNELSLLGRKLADPSER